MAKTVTLSTNASSENIAFQGSATVKIGGPDFNGASVVLELAHGDNVFVAIPDTTATENGVFNLDAAKGELRATMTDAGASSNVTVSVVNFRDLT